MKFKASQMLQEKASAEPKLEELKEYAKEGVDETDYNLKLIKSITPNIEIEEVCEGVTNNTQRILPEITKVLDGRNEEFKKETMKESSIVKKNNEAIDKSLSTVEKLKTELKNKSDISKPFNELPNSAKQYLEETLAVVLEHKGIVEDKLKENAQIAVQISNIRM